MPNRKPIKTTTIAIIAIVTLIFGFVSLYHFSGTRLGGYLTKIEFALNVLFIVFLAMAPFFLKRTKRFGTYKLTYIISFIMPIFCFPFLYYCLEWYAIPSNLRSLLILGNVIILSLSAYPFFMLYILGLSKEKKESQILAFAEGQKSLVFHVSGGIEGISVLKPNCPVRLELHQSEMRLYEFESIRYTDNAKSASLHYSQIITADVVNVKERGHHYIETITSYFVITYINKDGDEKQLRFKKSLFIGDFRFFMRALRSQLPNRSTSPTHTEL